MSELRWRKGNPGEVWKWILQQHLESPYRGDPGKWIDVPCEDIPPQPKSCVEELAKIVRGTYPQHGADEFIIAKAAIQFFEKLIDEVEEERDKDGVGRESPSMDALKERLHT